MHRFLILTFIVCRAHTPLLSQAWTIPAHTFDIFAGYSTLNYDAVYDSTGEIHALNTFYISDKTLQLAGRYGITNRLTIQAQIPYKLTKRFSEISSADILAMHGLGNIEAGVIYQYLESVPYLTASLFVEANTSDFNFISGLATGYNSWAFRPGLAYKSSYNNLWTSLYTAVEFRTNNYSNNFLFNLESGYMAMDKIYLAVNLYMRQSFANGTYCDCSLQETAMYPDKQEYFGAGVKSGFQLNRFGLHVAVNTAFAAQNVGAAPAVSASISYRSF
ncbi:MAG: hypothetical protein ACK4IY_03545 [Chitinophagales bacterium]